MKQSIINGSNFVVRSDSQLRAQISNGLPFQIFNRAPVEIVVKGVAPVRHRLVPVAFRSEEKKEDEWSETMIPL